MLQQIEQQIPDFDQLQRKEPRSPTNLSRIEEQNSHSSKKAMYRNRDFSRQHESVMSNSPYSEKNEYGQGKKAIKEKLEVYKQEI